MKYNTMNRKARQLLALLLSVVMLVSVFCATGLSLVFAAGENYASVAFGDGFMVTTGVAAPEGLNGSADGAQTYFHTYAEDVANGSAGNTVLGSAINVTGAYANRYALELHNSRGAWEMDDYLAIQIPEGTFADDAEIAIAVTYYYTKVADYHGGTYLEIAKDGVAIPNTGMHSWDAREAGQVLTFSTENMTEGKYAPKGSEVNGHTYRIGLSAANGYKDLPGYVFDVTFYVVG